MPRFSANISMLFTERPFLARIGAAAAAGFAAVECQFPYDEPADAIAAALKAAGIALDLHNLPAGDWAAGERGIAILPGRVSEFRDGVARARDYSRALGCRKLNCLAGIAPAGMSDAVLFKTMADNLAFAADALAADGIQLLIEPINTRDIPGFWLNRSAQALDLIQAVGAPNLALQYDVYHMQRMEGELAATLAAQLPRIGHIQIADTPGRGEPGTGEINFPFLFAHLDRLGYTGFVGAEYRPRGMTEAGLGWLRQASAALGGAA